MIVEISTEAAIDELARNPLRHVVLLKQRLAYPGHVKAYRAAGASGSAILLALEASASAYDRQTYPEAEVVAFISSDHPDLTESLLPCLPDDTGIVFKLSRGGFTSGRNKIFRDSAHSVRVLHIGPCRGAGC